jgi:cardiolipin synthase
VRWAILGALSQARERIRIVTPYFLPDTAISTALQVAALRGVAIDIAFPERNNLRLVQWAACAKIFQFIARGCRIWLTPPPFDHSKLMTVDGLWSFIGSTNWDPRSLRLNFEFNVECYEAALAAELDSLIDEKIVRARPLVLADVHNRGFPLKLRDGAAWLLSPYL